jgi:hypothetical protein
MLGLRRAASASTYAPRRRPIAQHFVMTRIESHSHKQPLRVEPRFRGEDEKVWNRRISLIPVRPGEGRLTEPTPAVQHLPGERVFVPHTCHSQDPSGAQLGPLTRPEMLAVAAVRERRVTSGM